MIVTYEAIDRRGVRQRDKMEAASTSEAADHLRRKGLYVTRVTEQGRGDRPSALRKPGSSAPRLPLKVLMNFTRQMAMLLKAGSGVVPAMQGIRRQLKHPQQRAVLERVIFDLEEGVPLAEALRRHPGSFDPVYCAIVAAGEASASLPPMFDRLAGIVGKRRAIRNRILGTLTYPALLVCMSVNIVVSILFFVLPRFGQMFEQLHADTPATTQFLLTIGEFTRAHWVWIVSLAAVAAIGTAAFLLSATGRQWLCDVQLRVPIVGGIRSKLIQAQVFRTMGMLLESKVGVLDTLELVRASTRNRRFQRMFNDLEHRVTSGGHLTASFEHSRLVEPYVCQAISTGEESGNLAEAMIYCADVLDETSLEHTNTFMRLIEPTILIGMGLVVGVVAISLFLPLFDLTSAMK